MPTINPTTTNTPNNPYHEVPFLPLENREQTTRHGAQFFSNVKQLSVGFGSKVFRVDRDGMWAGAEDFASAPWKVDWDGNMTASSITISGYVATGGSLADIGAGNITETYIGSNAITTAKIAANAITAGKINVTDLEAVSAIIGTIHTAASGHRVVINGTDDNVEVYNSSNVLTIVLDGSQTDFQQSQIRVGGGIFMTGGTDADYAYGTGVWTGGFGGSGIASFIDAVGASETGVFSVRSDGEVWHYGTNASPVVVLTDDGGIEADTDITVADGNFEISGDGFFNLAAMSGSTASGLTSQDGSMYYRTDDDVIRVKLNGSWVTVDTT